MIHLYAFADAGVRLPAVGGVGGSPLGLHVEGDVAAVVSSAEGAVDRDAALAHGRVVEALRETAEAVLPVRFGERFATDGELAAAVAARADELRRRLDHVRGCVEFGVRMQPPEAEEPSRASGGAYLRARLASVHRAAAIVEQLHEPLVRCAREAVLTPGIGDHAAAYLVRHEQRDAFERTLGAFIAAHPEVTVLCTGPWAPYTFAEAA